MGLREALKRQLALIAEDPSNGQLLRRAAELFQKLGDNRSAAEMYERVAECHIQQGFPLKAVAQLRLAVRLSPSLTTARERIATHLTDLGLIEEARAEYETLLKSFRWAGRENDVVRIAEAMARLGGAGSPTE